MHKRQARKVDWMVYFSIGSIYFYQSNLLNNPYTDLRLQAKYLYKKGDTFVDTVKKYVTDKGLSVIILKIDLYKYDKVKYRFFRDPNHP